MAEPVALRRAEPSDAVSLAALQREAYAPLKARVGTSLQPVDADFDEVLATFEVWIGGPSEALEAALIIGVRSDHLLIWSIAVSPRCKGGGMGTALLAFAERRAREEGLGEVRLYTNERFSENVAWYQRAGYAIERIEQKPDRRIVHFRKSI